MDKGEPEVLGKGRLHCVVHRGGEGYKNRVSLEGEDNPPPPPISRSVVLSLTVSQRAVQNFDAKLFFLISLKGKLSTRSSRVVGSTGQGWTPFSLMRVRCGVVHMR